MNKFQLKCSCIRCKMETTTGQLTRNHKNRCPSTKVEIRYPGNFGRPAWNKGLVGNPKCARKGVNIGSSHTDETKQRLSIVAKNRGFGGYQPNAGRTKKFKAVDSFGKSTTLQGTYELRCSEILNDLGVKWNRPGALKYDNRNYFADFYLPDYDVYLDPKNAYKAKLDEEKIQKVIEQNDVKVYIILEHQLTSEYILEILNPCR